MISHANRGIPLEEAIALSNLQYRKRGIAVIHKVPSEWLPIRNGKGKIVSAKITQKAPVDFIGRYKSTPIAFDAKSVAKENKWYIRELKQHQFNFLMDWANNKHSLSFVLLGFWLTRDFFLLPLDFIAEHYVEWKKGGSASLKLKELQKQFPAIKSKDGIALDYLTIVDQYIA